MADEHLPDELRDFIVRHIDSVAQLEALLLLRANPHETWDVARTAKRLYASESEAAMVLARLCQDGLLNCQDETFRYQPEPAAAATVDRLAEAYAHQLIAVTNIIHAKPRRIREFADAFKFRKDR
jgi:DNA-binding IclR family transcriptional regulator